MPSAAGISARSLRRRTARIAMVKRLDLKLPQVPVVESLRRVKALRTGGFSVSQCTGVTLAAGGQHTETALSS